MKIKQDCPSLDFYPTYLYIKQHSITGLKYFGKTVGNEKYLLETYKGSDNYWLNHLRIHGRQYVTTTWFKLFTNKDELVAYASFFSKEEDIVNAKDANGKKIWANEKLENGLDGGTPGLYHSEEYKQQQSARMLGKNKGKPSFFKNKIRPSLSVALRGNNNGAGNKGLTKTLKTCPHCGKVGGGGSMLQWHFDNCRSKICI